MNKTVKQIHDLLVTQVRNLSQAIGQTTDPDVAQQLLMEMQEVVHRVDLAQNLLFAKGSTDLDACLPKIQETNDALAKSIQAIQNTANFINGATEFLKYVDQALDLAKTLAL